HRDLKKKKAMGHFNSVDVVSCAASINTVTLSIEIVISTRRIFVLRSPLTAEVAS
ncbi:hypothetical protein K435DRAFT_781887, partial [Dendrothele bispora CBS 962.96]